MIQGDVDVDVAMVVLEKAVLWEGRVWRGEYGVKFQGL